MNKTHFDCFENSEFVVESNEQLKHFIKLKQIKCDFKKTLTPI